MLNKALTLFLVLFLSVACTKTSDHEHAHAQTNDDLSQNVKSYFVSPLDGDTVSSPFKVRFGLQGMGIAPAGVAKENTGHHHLLIDMTELPDMTTSLPATDNLIHFGGGQTETVLELPPGQHTLQLLLGDFAHRPHAEPVLSKKITITVK